MLRHDARCSVSLLCGTLYGEGCTESFLYLQKERYMMEQCIKK